jgi:hypothetical protein
MRKECEQHDITSLILHFSTTIGELSQVIPELIHTLIT